VRELVACERPDREVPDAAHRAVEQAAAVDDEDRVVVLGAGERALPERLDRVVPQRRLVDVADRDAHGVFAALDEDRREVVGEPRSVRLGPALDRDEPAPAPRVVQELLRDRLEQCSTRVRELDHAHKATPARGPAQGRPSGGDRRLGRTWNRDPSSPPRDLLRTASQAGEGRRHPFQETGGCSGRDGRFVPDERAIS
jgi:hypothetical protein